MKPENNWNFFLEAVTIITIRKEIKHRQVAGLNYCWQQTWDYLGHWLSTLSEEGPITKCFPKWSYDVFHCLLILFSAVQEGHRKLKKKIMFLYSWHLHVSSKNSRPWSDTHSVGGWMLMWG